MQGTGDQGQPLYQAYSIAVNQDLPLTINASGGTDRGGTVGQAFALDFFLSGGAGPYVWSVASGQLPPGLSLRTFAGPRDANDELAGTPTTGRSDGGQPPGRRRRPLNPATARRSSFRAAPGHFHGCSDSAVWMSSAALRSPAMVTTSP